MPREIEKVSEDKYGAEVHPAFGIIGASRVSQGGAGGGAVLFDSDVKHNHYVILRIGRASRQRSLHTDRIHEGGGRGEIVEVAMSEAQWASMISSMNTSGVPCTIRRTEKDGDIPGLDFDSRLDLTHREVRQKAQDALAEVREALEAVKAKPTKANIRDLETRLGNAPANLEFAAQRLTEHAEAVVSKSKADIEAFVINKAQEVGLNPRTWTPVEELDAEREPKELEG